MTLIIGGRCSGKYQELLKRGYNQADIGNTFGHRAVYKLNDIIKQMLLDCNNPVNDIKCIIENGNLPQVIVCDEVGAGIVPMDKADRDYREAVGRVCTMLAQHADTVYRVYSGISVKIK